MTYFVKICSIDNQAYSYEQKTDKNNTNFDSTMGKVMLKMILVAAYKDLRAFYNLNCYI